MKKVFLVIVSFIIFMIFCLTLNSLKLKKTYSDFKEDISFEKNSKFNLNGILKLDSTTVNPKILSNKTTLIQFSFKGCGPCQKAKKRFPKLLNQTDENFQIITISIDKFDFWKSLEENISERRWTKLNIGGSNLINSLKVIGYPTYFIVNKKGNIVSRPSHFDGIKAIRSYYKIKPNILDLLNEHSSNLLDTNRFSNFIYVYSILYLFLFGIVILIRFLIKKTLGNTGCTSP
ncbi:thioredoxin-like domain-containing protein [Seonamhaeicola sp. S2-3]|uniref:TlpA family protein disulfide reductase n=1 Tax=Seonamhaeicola sp. S2-3 TaxID=1936081 RepID=UPI0018DCBD5B|nr:thioredoxin-like domain-containing protein [Seonamhaeicola sp. S2-3]